LKNKKSNDKKSKTDKNEEEKKLEDLEYTSGESEDDWKQIFIGLGPLERKMWIE